MSARSDSPSRTRHHTALVSWGLSLALLVAVVAIPQPSSAALGTFWDDDGSTHEGNIEAIAAEGITKSCGNGKFCPNDPVTRGEMAAFLHRSLQGKIQIGSATHFSDVSSSIFADDIAWLSAAGITKGCGSGRFCPNDPVTREQLAAFLRRALEHVVPTGSPTHFSDVSSSTFADDIAWLSASDITKGCAPGRFCPMDLVTREQMASFLARALGLKPIPPTGSTGVSNRTASGPITVSNQSGVTIENVSISNPNGPCVRIEGSSRVTIKNSTIGPCGDWGVFIDKSSDVTVQNTRIRTDSSKGGIYGHGSRSIVVTDNFIDRSGRNPVQFDKVTGPGNRIDNNTIVSNAAEDMISVYKSSGTSGSWLRVTRNVVQDNTGQSGSGSGILVGDAGGSFILVEGNQLTGPGQAGIGVASGSNIRIINNSVKSPRLPWSNVGIYVWNQYGSGCNNIEVRGNFVDWKNSSGQSNPAFNGGGCGKIAGWGQNSW